MKSEDILSALGAVDEKFLRACENTAVHKFPARTIVSVAACLALAVASVLGARHLTNRPEAEVVESVTEAVYSETTPEQPQVEGAIPIVPDSDVSQTTEKTTVTPPYEAAAAPSLSGGIRTEEATAKGDSQQEMAIESSNNAFANAPTDATRYPKFLYKGNYYMSRGNTNPVTQGNAMETVTLQGFDAVHTAKGEIYKIRDISPDAAVAVKFVNTGEIYVYVNRDYKPATFGAFYDALNLSQTMTIGKIGKGPTYYKGVPESEVRKLFVRSAPGRTGDHASGIDIHISVPSLGYPSGSIFVTEDGYLYTTLLGGENSFFIGKETAKAFYDYIEKNCEAVSLEPTTTVGATVVVCTGAQTKPAE